MSLDLFSTPLLAAFLVTSFVLAVTPGPGVVYIVARTLAQGRGAGLASVAGVAAGNLGNAVGAALGLAALFAVSSLAFSVVKFAGAAYLIYLGISTLRSHDAFDRPADDARASLPAGQAYLQGLVSALLNPKLGVFFLTLLPQFIVPGQPPAAQALRLAVIFDLIGLAWLFAYSAMLGALGRALGDTPRRVIRWVSGTVLVALGVRVALERS